MKITEARKTAALLFLGLSCAYLALSPASVAGQGYTGEDIQSGLQTLAVVNAWLKHRPRLPMAWSRNGPVSVLFDLPFLKVGKFIVSPDFILSFQPVLLTAGLLTLLFLWLRRLCSPGMSLFLTLTTAFGTMLWPYAYIGLETKQSFLVLLAGYLGLSREKIRSWPKILLFGAICGAALTVKSVGISLVPAIAYLAYIQFRGEWRSRRAQVLAFVVMSGAIWSIGAWGRNFYWDPRGGGLNSFVQVWFVDSPLRVFTNMIGVLGSPTKGLLVYAPVLIASLYAVPCAFRAHRNLVTYAVLVTACALGMITLLLNPVDEVWGCRYMHVAIAPLVLCIGAAWPRFHWRRQGLIAVLTIAGVVISFLGAFYYYGVQEFAMRNADQNVLEWITGDDAWNQIDFNARLLRVWLFDSGTTPVLWTPRHIWVWSPPPGAPPPKSIDLREYCQPQSFLLRFWRAPPSGNISRILRMYEVCLLAGVSLLGWVIARTYKAARLAAPN